VIEELNFFSAEFQPCRGIQITSIENMGAMFHLRYTVSMIQYSNACIGCLKRFYWKENMVALHHLTETIKRIFIIVL